MEQPGPHCLTDQINISSDFDTRTYFSLLTQSCSELLESFFCLYAVYLFESEMKTGVSGPVRFISRFDRS